MLTIVYSCRQPLPKKHFRPFSADSSSTTNPLLKLYIITLIYILSPNPGRLFFGNVSLISAICNIINII